MQTIRFYLELGELIRLQLLSAQNQVDYMLRQESEGSKVEDIIAVIINKLHHLQEAYLITTSVICNQFGNDHLPFDYIFIFQQIC